MINDFVQSVRKIYGALEGEIQFNFLNNAPGKILKRVLEYELKRSNRDVDCLMESPKNTKGVASL